MGFLIRRAFIRMTLGGAGALSARLEHLRTALAPQPVKATVRAPRFCPCPARRPGA